MTTPYHPNNSQLSQDKLAEYIRAPVGLRIDSGVEGMGLGPVTLAKLEAESVTTGYQLHAKFLSFKDADTSPQEHVQRFYDWIVLVVPSQAARYRSGIVHAVAMKADLMYGSLYDPGVYPGMD